MADAKPDILAIFTESLARESDEERSRHLDEACQGDPQVRGRVEALLRAHSDAGNFLGGQSPAATPSIERPITEQSGTLIGRYKLLELIGEGGFGDVYMAEQTEPVRRKVALKIIKPGMDTKEVIARFEAEEQALAMMDHPNIAKVHDLGATESSRPYFVMELVHGIPLTEYCDQNELTTDQRLELFVSVCQAVQHAHQKGIIHRDLKPSNVMVTLHDGVPVPKIIDFGIAKATDRHLTERTVFTSYGQMIGTPLYMSPEQAEMSGLDIDTRSDIYSLGVLLYEMLTGSTPFEAERIREAGYDEMRRMIREEEPPRPSNRISTLAAEAATTASTHRKTDPAKLSHLLHGELDWIVMKALEKDRTRRYETASDLAKDVKRYLDDEAVEACPPSAGYRFGKFVRRNKRVMVFAGAVAAALAIGLVGTAWQAVRATRAEQTALAVAETAQQKAAESNAVVDFLVNDLLSSAAPEKALGRQVEMLAEAEKKIDTAFTDQPVVEAAIRHTLGATYYKLSKYKPAVRHLTCAIELRARHLSAEHVDTLSSRYTLARVFEVQSNFDEARKLHEETLEIRRRVLGPEHQDTLESMCDVAYWLRQQGKFSESLKLQEKTLEISRRVLGPEHPITLTSMCEAAYWLWEQGKFSEALKLQEKTLEISRRVLGPEHPITLTSMRCLGLVLADQGKLAEALKLQEKTLEISRRVLGPEHKYTLVSMRYVGRVLKEQGKLAEAQKLLEEALEISLRVLGPKNTEILWQTQNLAGIYSSQGKLAELQKLYEEVFEMKRRALGPEHQDTIDSMHHLAHALANQGKLAELQKLYEGVFEMKRRVLGPEHQDTIDSMHHLARALANQGKYAEAHKLFEEVLEIRRRVLGPEHEDTIDSMDDLAYTFRDQGKYAEAQKLLEEVLDIRRRVLGPEHPDTLDSILNLAMVSQVDYLPTAKKHYDEVLELDLDKYSNPEILNLYKNRGAISWYLEDYEDAIADFEKALQINSNDVGAHLWLCKALAICPEMERRDEHRAIEMGEASVKLSPTYFQAWAWLGAAHYVAGDYDAAISALNKGFEVSPSTRDSRAGFYLAMIHWRSDQKQEAVEWYDKATNWASPKGPAYQAEIGRIRDQAVELLGLKRGDEDQETTEEESAKDEQQSTELETNP